MKIEIKRDTYTKTSTIGKLYIDGVFECYTLEDVSRANGQKVWGATAIPSGAYKLVVNLSQRFGTRLPLLLDVPNFSGIRIHAGNTAKDTHGCILVGSTRDKDFIGGSRNALAALLKKINKAIEKKESATVTIVDGVDTTLALKKPRK